jgi:hypothetical protein
MDRVLRNFTGPVCWSFIDDVLIFIDTVEEHARCLRHVLERFEKAHMQLEPSKCDSAKDPVTYLGYTLSGRGMESSSIKVKAVQ